MEVLNTDPRQLSPLNLAFIGDCVYEMQVRCHLVALANRPVNDLHRCLSGGAMPRPATSPRAPPLASTTAPPGWRHCSAICT